LPVLILIIINYLVAQLVTTIAYGAGVQFLG
jgi:hypothetical protein